MIFNPNVQNDLFLVNTIVPATQQILTCSTTPASGFTMFLQIGTGGAMPSSGTDNGTGVQIWDCGAGANQRWKFENGHLVDSNSGRCLDIPYLDIKDGTKLQIWDCGTQENQQWQLPN